MVREREFDLAMLGRHCDRVDIPPDLNVTKTINGARPEAWSVIALAIEAPRVTGQRLDRLLAGELGLTRSELHAMAKAGGLQMESASAKPCENP